MDPPTPLPKPEAFTLQPPPTTPRAVVYPYNADGAKWHELRFSLRSVDRFFEDKDCPILIFGTRRPAWLMRHPRVVWHDSWSYQDARSRGVQAADEVLWMNDDIVLLTPVGWECFKQPFYLNRITPEFRRNFADNTNPWRAGFLRAVAALEAHGRTNLWNFSTHTPYLYKRTECIEVFRRFGIWAKIPLETLVFNWFPYEALPLGDRRALKPPFGNALFLNYTDALLTGELMDALRELLPERSARELPTRTRI